MSHNNWLLVQLTLLVILFVTKQIACLIIKSPCSGSYAKAVPINVLGYVLYKTRQQMQTNVLSCLMWLLLLLIKTNYLRNKKLAPFLFFLLLQILITLENIFLQLYVKQHNQKLLRSSYTLLRENQLQNFFFANVQGKYKWSSLASLPECSSGLSLEAHLNPAYLASSTNRAYKIGFSVLNGNRSNEAQILLT